MKRICSWCGKDMGSKPGGAGTTDGICESCKAKLLAKPKASIISLDGGGVSPPLTAPRPF